MVVKKANGRVLGASLTKTEQKALEMEIQRQYSEYIKKFENEIEDNLIEFAVRFYKLIKDYKVARLEMFADAFIAFEYDIDFFKDLANYQMTSIEDSKLTKDTLINLLLKHGYTEEQDD